MGEPQSIFVKWVFPSILWGLAFLFFVATLAGIAIELRELKRADEELKWRQEQTKNIDWSAPASR